MTKGKKIIIAVVAVLVVATALGIYLYVRADRTADVSFTIKDTLPDGGGREATVILLGGQSNASGCSSDEYLKKNSSQEQYAEYENGYSNVYINYYATGTNFSEEFVNCAARQGEAGGYFGPELGLADKLNEVYPDRTFFIIKCAWGGTNLYKQWRAPSSFGRTGNLYNNFVSFANKSLEYIESKNYDIKIEAMCWMQGESDSFSVKNATEYEQNLKDFIKDIRKEFKRYASDDGIAFVDAYIADNPTYWVYCDEVNESKTKVADSSEMNAVVDTVGAGLTCSEEPVDAPDLAHYDSLSQIKLGRMFAEEAIKFFDD